MQIHQIRCRRRKKYLQKKPPTAPQDKDKIVIHDNSLHARLQDVTTGVNNVASPNTDNQMAIEKNDNEPLTEKASIVRYNSSKMDVTYSEFLPPEQKKQNDLLGDLMKDHSKFKGLMTNRINALKPVLHWWSTGNIKPALNAITMMNINEPTLVLDLVTMSLVMNRGNQILPDMGSVFLQKSSILLDSKIDVHIRKGIEFIEKILKMFHDEIVSIKNVALMGGVDIAREDRVKKYDKLIDEFNNIYNKESLKRRAEKKKDDIGEASSRLRNELESFLNKVRKVG